MKRYIQRTAGKFTDTLSALWEGDDLPSFMRNGNPYLFDDHQAAIRVLWRLQAKYPVTFATEHFPAIPITYEIVSIDTTIGDTQHVTPTQHLAMFL